MFQQLKDGIIFFKSFFTINAQKKIYKIKYKNYQKKKEKKNQIFILKHIINTKSINY